MSKMDNTKIISITQKPPFTIISYERNGKQKHFIAVGKVKMEEEYDTFEECEKQIENVNWQLVTMLIEAYIMYYNKQKEQNNGRNNKNN